MNEWIEELADLSASAEAAVLVTVVGIRGSAPREVGAKMIVTAEATIGTIGGGQLEYECTRLACSRLGNDDPPVLRRFLLGASMGQCCGGVVDILFEPIAAGLPAWLIGLRALLGRREPAILVTHLEEPPAKFIVTVTNTFHEPAGISADVVDRAREGLETIRAAHRRDDWLFETIVASNFNIAVFGAGHVGSAVVRALSSLDCNILWIDSRRDFFRSTPPNVRAVETPEPALEVAVMSAGSCYLIMTHSHTIDYDICTHILARGDATYCGLIGSRSKRRRFEKRFRAQGLPPELIDKLTCPIGVEGISGKKPAEIAVAGAADLLRAHERSARLRLSGYPENVRAFRGRR